MRQTKSELLELIVNIIADTHDISIEDTTDVFLDEVNNAAEEILNLCIENIP